MIFGVVAGLLAAMFFLFGCFGTIGVVYGNILQSLRGVISILVGFLIARMGFVSLEEKVGRGCSF